MNYFSCGRSQLVGLLLFYGWAIPNTTFGQRDSIALEEVQIRAVLPERYMAGLYVQSADSAVLRQFAFRRLDEILAQSTTLAFRNYGNGQLSTVAFRGLSSNHTAVLWNGVNINLPTLGQSDFSSMPVASFDRMTVVYGAGATHLGTDAIGGSIALESGALQTGRLAARAGLEYGSFRNRAAQATARYRDQLSEAWVLAGKTQFYSAGYPNRYPSPMFKGRRLEHSATFQKGFVQDLFLEHSSGKVISAHLWLNDHELTLWPGRVASRELTALRNFRSMIRYGDGKWNVRAAFIRDVIDYATGTYTALDRATVDKLSVKADREWKWKSGLIDGSVLAGTEATYFNARVNGYGVPRVDETRGDAFMLTRIGFRSGAVVSVNLRQSFAQDFNVPFTPSAGIAYPLVRAEQYQLTASASLARSYRLPTLNERYWKDLGNPDMRPESAWNRELGVAQRYAAGAFGWESRFNLFYNKVDDWVYWNPERNYRAENLQQVVARGVELHNSLSFATGKWKAGLQSLVGYTRSTQEKAYGAYTADVLGKQLRFTPVWVSNLNGYVRYAATQLSLQHHFESVRYTTFDNRQYLPAYALMHLLLEQRFKAGPTSFQLQGRVSNLTNELYLSARSAAMPGRSFQVSLLVDYQL